MMTPAIHDAVAPVVRSIAVQRPLIADEARSASISSWDLELQALLYLPRLMDDHYRVEPLSLRAELRRLAALIGQRQHPCGAWLEPPASLPASPLATEFGTVVDDEARVIHERFHYLASFREGSMHFGLRTRPENRLVALLTLSPFDLQHVALPAELGSGEQEALVVSRVFAFDWAPRNTLSHLLACSARAARGLEHPIRMLLTYVNPNMGFTGASYRAANWVPYGIEEGTRYSYVDDRYVTDRRLERLYGSAEPGHLRTVLRGRFATSRVPLEPLLLYGQFLDRDLARRYSEGFAYTFRRP